MKIWANSWFSTTEPSLISIYYLDIWDKVFVHIVTHECSHSFFYSTGRVRVNTYEDRNINPTTEIELAVERKPFIVKEMVIDILFNDIIAQAVERKRWLCPICGMYDSVCGNADKEEVRNHILRRHGKYLMNVRIQATGTKEKKLYKCETCSDFFRDPPSLMRHIAFAGHNMVTIFIFFPSKCMHT